MYTKDYVSIILNDNTDKQDGRIVSETYDNSHIKSIIQISKRLKQEGIEMGYFDKRMAEEAAFNLIQNGHIVFFNINDKLAFLKLPAKISKKQYESLKIFAEELKNYYLYEQTINPSNPECLISVVHDKTYELKKSKYINIK